MSKLKKGDKVVVMDQGLIQLYQMMKSFGQNVKPQNQGWVDSIDGDTVYVLFPIGDDDPEEHSQLSPYPANLVVKQDW